MKTKKQRTKQRYTIKKGRGEVKIKKYRVAVVMNHLESTPSDPVMI